MIKDDLQALIDAQAKNEALWSVPLYREETMAEYELKIALRKLHAAIEKRNIHEKAI